MEYVLFKKEKIMVESLPVPTFMGTGAGEKNTRSRSKTDQLRKTIEDYITLSKAYNQRQNNNNHCTCRDDMLL